jgi:transposase
MSEDRTPYLHLVPAPPPLLAPVKAQLLAACQAQQAALLAEIAVLTELHARYAAVAQALQRMPGDVAAHLAGMLAALEGER